MAKRRDVPTTKISVAVSQEDLQTLRARAKRLHGGNLSAAVADAAAKLRREEAGHRVLARLDAAPLNERRAQEIDAELESKPTPVRRRKGRP
jgi:hypothetical protein